MKRYGLLLPFLMVALFFSFNSESISNELPLSIEISYTDQNDQPVFLTLNKREVPTISGSRRIAYGQENSIVAQLTPNGIGQRWQNGQPRYIGYTVDGFPYYNIDYPPDVFGAGFSPAWIALVEKPWESINYVQRNIDTWPARLQGKKTEIWNQVAKAFRDYWINNESARNINMTPERGFAYNPLISDGAGTIDINKLQNYVKIVSFPDEITDGQAMVWHIENGNTYYVSVIVPAIGAAQPDLALTSIDTPGEITPYTPFSATVYIANTHTQPITTHLAWSLNDPDYATQPLVQPITIPAGGTYAHPIDFPGGLPEGSHVIYAFVNQRKDQPKNEPDYTNNEAEAIITVKPNIIPQKFGGGDELKLQARGFRTGEFRPPYEARWMDWVTATIEPNKIITATRTGDVIPPGYIAPPVIQSSCTSFTSLVDWEITEAQLTWPKRHPEWTFNDPMPPEGTNTKAMTPEGHIATLDFKEDWSNAGFEMFAILQDPNKLTNAEPETFPVSVTYTVKITYDYWRYELGCCGKKCSPCCILVDSGRAEHYMTFTKDATLLVNGLGDVAPASNG